MSGGGISRDAAVNSREDGGSATGLSGCAKSASSFSACCETGVRARFLTGRWERRSEEVGTESGPGSDILCRMSCLYVDGDFVMYRKNSCQRLSQTMCSWT